MTKTEIIALLFLIPPLILGLIFAIKSPFAKGGRTRCFYCRERIHVSASVCPYCHRKTSSIFSGYKTRTFQFFVGYFIGAIIELIVAALIIKLLLHLGL